MARDGCDGRDLSGRGERLFRVQYAVQHSAWRSYTLLNLRVGVINGPWSVTAFARNLTDKRAQVSAINSSQDPDALLTVRPRTIGLTATRKF